MNLRRIITFAGIVAGAAGCSDANPSAPREPRSASHQVIIPSNYECALATVEISPTSATIDAGDTQTFTAAVWGVDTGGDRCSPPDVTYTWSTTAPAEIRSTTSNSATVGAKLVNGGTAGGSAGVYLKAVQTEPGGTRTRTTDATLTIRSRAPAPTLTAVTGPTSIPVVGNYSFSVSASGGTGTYTYTWERSLDGSTWLNFATQTGGGSSTVTTNIEQQFTQIRVRVVSGNSAEAIGGLNVDGTHALDVVINKPTKITTEGAYTWEAMPSGGSGGYTYRWDSNETTKTYSKWIDRCWPDPGVTVTVTVTSGAYSVTRSASSPVMFPPGYCSGL
jgi:hypothetical protein